jgi:hypothetical protein
MVDNFSILLSHGLLILTFWFLTQRDDVNDEAPPPPDSEPEGFAKGLKVKSKIERPSAHNPMRKPSASKRAREQEAGNGRSGNA